MNDEIKDILDYLSDFNREKPFGLSIYDIKIILSDYITNLQEENERLKTKIDEVINKQQFIEEKFDYKSRNEKAIEYCNYNDESLYTFEPDYDYEENMIDNYEPSNFREDLLKILNGDDNNE